MWPASYGDLKTAAMCAVHGLGFGLVCGVDNRGEPARAGVYTDMSSERIYYI